ncbi:MAG: ABC transporter permease [Saprospiraceae bacterium]
MFFKNKIAKQANKPPTYWEYVKRQFVKNKRALYASYVVIFLLFIGVFADFLANDKPIVMKYNGQWYTPVLKEYVVDFGMGKWSKELINVKWKNLETDVAIWPLIPYKPTTYDKSVPQYAVPMTQGDNGKHWIGTDKLGRDVAAGMIHGTRIALSVGLVAMSIAFIIGVFLGTLAGFYGDDKFRVSRIRLILNISFLPFAYFYGFMVRSYVLSEAISTSIFYFLIQFLLSLLIFIGVLLLPNLLTIPLKKIKALGKKIKIPLDILLTRFIEIVVSIPVLVLILVIIAIAKPSIYNVMIIIGLVGWTGIARFVRAELLKIRQLEYIEATEALGYSNMRKMFRHAVPNALSPVFISVAFGIASAILIEALLSFLGIGVPVDTITWGKLLNLSRSNSSAWWLAIFPGLAIFITVTVFNLIGEGLTDALDPKLKK